MAKKIGQGQHILLTGPKGDVFHLDEGDTVPDWAKDMLGDHVYQDVDSDADQVDGDGDGEDTGDGPPPKSGKGSGKDAWRAYAAANDVEVEEGTSAKDVIAALESAGVPTE